MSPIKLTIQLTSFLLLTALVRGQASLQTAPDGVSTGAQVRVRKNASLDAPVVDSLSADEKVFILRRGTEKFTIDGESHPWIEVRKRSGGRGWVYGKYIRTGDNPFCVGLVERDVLIPFACRLGGSWVADQGSSNSPESIPAVKLLFSSARTWRVFGDGIERDVQASDWAIGGYYFTTPGFKTIPPLPVLGADAVPWMAATPHPGTGITGFVPMAQDDPLLERIRPLLPGIMEKSRVRIEDRIHKASTVCKEASQMIRHAEKGCEYRRSGPGSTGAVYIAIFCAEPAEPETDLLVEAILSVKEKDEPSILWRSENVANCFESWDPEDPTPLGLLRAEDGIHILFSVRGYESLRYCILPPTGEMACASGGGL
jgi:hypothetical protein